MAVHGGPFDVHLEFAFRPTAASDPEPQVSVTMSWEHAAAMVKAIQVLVDDYQENVGPIPNLENVRSHE